VIFHIENDWDIPYTHSQVLFEAFMEPLLPPVVFPPFGTILQEEEYTKVNAQITARNQVKASLVGSTVIHNFGTIEAFKSGAREVTFVRTLVGEHNSIGLQEGVQDVIGLKFGLV
jgi:abhydrolase domain-containing protein 12